MVYIHEKIMQYHPLKTRIDKTLTLLDSTLIEIEKIIDYKNTDNPKFILDKQTKSEFIEIHSVLDWAIEKIKKVTILT
jgi:hypothetical protein